MAKEIWTVYRRCYPQFDEDMCWEFEMNYFDKREDAIKFANELEENYADDGWDGHKYYKCKFYADTITREVIDEKQRMWAIRMAHSM